MIAFLDSKKREPAARSEEERRLPGSRAGYRSERESKRQETVRIRAFAVRIREEGNGRDRNSGSDQTCGTH